MAETILDEILRTKVVEVQDRASQVPLGDIKAQAQDTASPRDFLGALAMPNRPGMALIAEVKKASPSAGIIRPDFDPVAIAQAYAGAKADCLSVLTDSKYFQGHDTFLQNVRAAVDIPLLRKDFTVSEYQIYEARVLGADAVLLIAAALSETQLQEFHGLAQLLGLAALVEVHTADEMRTAADMGAALIGINSRNLATFITDLDVVAQLAPLAPQGCLLVAESGLRTPADVHRVQAAGARAILVGETLMRSPDIASAIAQLLPT